MTRSKKILLSFFIFVLIISIIVFCLFSYGNLDNANAVNYYTTDSYSSVLFPFQARSVLVNFTGLNFSLDFSGTTTSSTTNTLSDHYRYIIPSGYRNGAFLAYLENENFNGVDIVMQYFTASYVSHTSDYFYRIDCKYDFVSGKTYYINMIVESATSYQILSSYYCFRLGNNYSYGDSWIENTRVSDFYSGTSSLVNGTNYYILSVPFTPTSDFNSIAYYHKLNGVNYSFTISDSPTFNISGQYYGYYNLGNTNSSNYLSSPSSVYLNNVLSEDGMKTFANLFNPSSISYSNLMLTMVPISGSSNEYFYFQSWSYIPQVVYTDYYCYKSNVYSSSGNFYGVAYFYLYGSSGYNYIDFYIYNNSSLGVAVNSNFYNFSVEISFIATGYDNYMAGYLAGYSEAKLFNYSEFYNNGYSDGYDDGLDIAQNGTFLVLLTSVIEAPFNAFLQMFDFEILGYNMKSFLGALITVSLALFVIRMILNGSTKNG